MRVASNSVSENILSQIQKLATQQSKLQTQVSTGKKLSQPEDDPAAVGRVLGLQSEQRRVSQYENNASRASEISTASYAGLQAIKKVSSRVSEIATLGTGVLSSSQTEAYAAEVNQLLEQTLQLANSKFENDYLYSGTNVGVQPYTVTRDTTTGDVDTILYNGNSSQQQIQLSESATVSPGTTGDTNQSLKDFMDQLVQLRDALNVGDTTTITSVQTGLTTSEDSIVSSLAEAGAVQTRIEAYQTQLKDRSNDIEKLISGEADADITSSVVKLSQTQTAYQAALQSSASIMKTSLLDYIK